MTQPVSSGLTRPPRRAIWTAVQVLLWAAVFVFFARGFAPLNDHYGRIAPARQIARYGAMPFRDFVDPGYYLTEFSSAALQWLLGDNLLGELLLTVSFVATGTVLVFQLARRAAASGAVGLIAAGFVVSAMPRLYDYDKVLFYPLGLLLCWHYLDRRDTRSLVLLAAGIVLAGLYRYDNGVFILLAACAAIAAVAGRQWRVAIRDGSCLVLAALLFATPALAAVQMTSGLRDAFYQVVTYAKREGARTRITSWPGFQPGPWFRIVAKPVQETAIKIRWAPGIDDTARSAIEQRFDLRAGQHDGPAESRTWSYRFVQPTRERLRLLVGDPSVEDTSGIDRSTLDVEPEPLWRRLQRAFPLLRWEVLPGLSDFSSASAFLFYVLIAVPILLVVVMGFERGPQRVYLTPVLVMCVLLDVFILRDPVAARIGGMAGPSAVAAAWLVGRLRDGRRAVTDDGRPNRRVRWASSGLALTGLFVLVLTWRCLAAVGGVPVRHTVEALITGIGSDLRRVSVSPPSLELLPTGRLAPLVTYVRSCTADDDRIYATWFVPELFVFAQRGFAGGMAVTFGSHWSEPQNQRRILAQWAKESVPLVVTDQGSLENFVSTYPEVAAYVMAHYREAGRLTVNQDQFLILADRSRVPSGIDPRTSLPCFRR